MEIVKLTAAEFDSFALKYPWGNYLQTSNMHELRLKLGWDSHLLAFKQNGEIIGATNIAGRDGRYEILYGPLLSLASDPQAAQCLQLLEDFVRQLGGHVLYIHPAQPHNIRDAGGQITSTDKHDVIGTMQGLGWHYEGFNPRLIMSAIRWVFVKDLSQFDDQTQLLASYRQRTRANVRKIEPDKYSLRQLERSQMDIVQRLLADSNELHNLHSRDVQYFYDMYDTFGDRVRFMASYYEDTPVSVGVFMYHPHEVLYLLGGTDSQHRHLRGNLHLQHAMMVQCISEGVKRYNFYGIEGTFTNNPLLVYKAGFRGFVEEYYGGFHKVLDPRKHLLAKARRAPRAAARQIVHKIRRK